MVCLDESPLQLIGEVREPIPAAPGQVERVDYEYRRNGTVNLFVAVDAHRPWRKVTVTEQRTARDYAKRLRELVDVDYPDAGCIRVVQDNLSTHTPGSLYEAFPPPEAHRILERLEFHYTPKHGRDRGAQTPVPGPAHRRPRGTRARRGAFRSVVDLQAAINRYLDEANHDPKPFVWTAHPDKIIAAVKRGRQTLESIH